MSSGALGALGAAKRWPHWLTVARWTAIGWVVLFWRLGYTGLLDPDEAHYAQLTREMVRARSWFIPLLDGSPFIDKPVFFHWVQALSVALLGESELGNRIPSALAAVGLIAITWWVSTQLFERSGELAAVMFATLPATFALANVGLFDMLFTALLFGGIACLLVAAVRRRTRLQFVGYIFLTLAVMTKGPVALLLVLLLFTAAWCIGGEPRALIGRLPWGSGLAIVTLASLPWFVWMSGRFGDRFVRDYVLAGNVWYFTSPKEFSTRASDPAFYLRTFVGAFFPWNVILVGGALDAFASWRQIRRSGQEVWLWLWIVLVVAFFSAARFKLDTYIYPAAPACAILAGLAWRRAAEDPRQRWTRAAAVLVALTLIVGGTIVAVALFQIDLGLDAAAVLLPVTLVAGGGALLFQMRRRHWSVPATAGVPAVTLLVAYVAVVLLGFPVLESSRPTRPLGRWIAKHTAAGIPVGIYGLEDWRASIRYYTDHTVTRLEDPDAVRSFLAQRPTAKVLMLRDDYRAMQDSGLDIQEVAARRAIVGRKGKYFRRQIWGRLVVVTRRDYADSLARLEWDLQ